MTIEQRAKALVGDMPWVTEHLTDAQIIDLRKQIATSMQAATEDVETPNAAYETLAKQFRDSQAGDIEGTQESLAQCAKMLETYAPDLYPANDKGQVHFARVMMESVASEITEFCRAKLTQTSDAFRAAAEIEAQTPITVGTTDPVRTADVSDGTYFKDDLDGGRLVAKSIPEAIAIARDSTEPPTQRVVFATDLSLDRILYCVQAELKYARAKFPDNKTNFTALVEEVGELAEALLKKRTADVFAEAVQVIVMALRVIQEPDESHGVTLSYDDYKMFDVNKKVVR